MAGTRPELLEKVVHPDCINGSPNGCYVLRFWKDGKQKIITVDDQFPIHSPSQPIAYFASIMMDKKTKIGEFWVPIFEKAYAKLHNGFDAIDGGRPEAAVVDLTNGISEMIRMEGDKFEEQVADGSFWRMIQEGVLKKDILTCGSQGTSDENKSDLGIVEGHAYAILDAQEVEGNLLVQLRNPWGRTEWKGEWSDLDTKNWTKRRMMMVDV